MLGTLQRGLNDRRKTFQRVGEPAAQPLHFAWSSQPTNGREVRRAEKLSGTLQEDGGGQATRIDAVIAIAGGMDVSIDGLVGGAVDSPSPRLSQKDDAMVCFGLLFGGLGSQERVAGTGCESGRRRRGGRFQARRGLPGSGMPKWRQSRCRSSVRACASLRLPLMPSETIERPFLSAYMACSNKRNRKPNRSRSAQIAPTAQLISLHQFLTPAFAHSANPAKSPRSCQTF